MNTDKYLPLGSVVRIEDYGKELMIIGYMSYSEANPNEVIRGDYLGIPVEEEFKGDNLVLFDKERITNIIFMGYKTQIIINQLNRLDETLKILKSSKNADDFLDKIATGIIKNETNSGEYTKGKSIISKSISQKGDK